MVPTTAHRLLAVMSGLCVSVFSFEGIAQQTDSVRFDVSVGGAYHDILRYSSEKIHSTTFVREQGVDLRASLPADTFSVSIEAEKQYSAVANSASAFSTAFESSSSSLMIGWKRGFAWATWYLRLRVPLDRTDPFFHYPGAAIRLEPFDPALNVGGEWERLPSRFSNAFTVEDYAPLANENDETVHWNVRAMSRPLSPLSLSFMWMERWSTAGGRGNGYSIPHRSGSYGHRVEAATDALEKIRLFVREERTTRILSSVMNSDGVMFGDVAFGKGTLQGWTGGGETNLAGVPFACELSYVSGDFDAVGHLESWPFTSLAATVFTNRLYYVLDGAIGIASLSSRATFATGDFLIEPALAYSRIRTDVSVTHWEPEFLIFGVKNRAVDAVPVEQCSAVSLSCSVSVPLLSGQLHVSAFQIIPFAVVEKGSSGGSGLPGTPSGGGPRSSTDGGRSIRISWSTMER